MNIQTRGLHLVNGRWVGSDRTFLSEPVTGTPQAYATGTVDLVELACAAAEAAFADYAALPRANRADFLETIAAEIEARGEKIIALGTLETGLPAARLEGERGRTVLQLRLFAGHIRKGDYLDRRRDPALPERAPAPRPEIRMLQRPIGPVAVFGASNFPLAFSTAGGDTAAALAAGCPVVVKGHSAHPGTSEVVTEAILSAIQACGLPPGIFSLIQGGDRRVGQALVQHPAICAVGFTGSLTGGRALFDLCAQRPTPIPFFGELGSVNPMFVLPHAASARAESIGAAWAASLTMGAGQFCTNPGLCLVLDGVDAGRLIDATRAALAAVPPQTMLTAGIARAYHAGVERLTSRNSVRPVLVSTPQDRMAGPNLFETDAETFLADHVLQEEVFGACGLVVRVASLSQMRQVAGQFAGQLTMALHCDPADHDDARALIPIMEHKAGRVLINGFPTGVEVVDSMVHGGPYPASTNFGATSVGTLSIRRFLRPVSYQNFPPDLLPEDLVG